MKVKVRNDQECGSCTFKTKCRWVAFDEPDEEGDTGMWTCGVCFALPPLDDEASEEAHDIFRAVAFATNVYLARLDALEKKLDAALGVKAERSVANGEKNEPEEEDERTG
jgi:hypothetical protein